MTKVFDGESAELMVKGLRETFSRGKTKSYEWRISQLNKILEITRCHEKEIVDALHSDLGKPEFESFIHEVYLSASKFMLMLYKLNHFRWRN